MNQARIYWRAYTALQLRDVSNEVPLSTISKRYNIPRGNVQTLAQTCHSFAAGMVKFCQRMGWGMLAAVFEHMRDRLQAGARADLLEMAQVAYVKSRTARIFWENGFRSVRALAESDPTDLVPVLMMVSFLKNQSSIKPLKCFWFLVFSWLPPCMIPSTKLFLKRTRRNRGKGRVINIVKGRRDTMPNYLPKQRSLLAQLISFGVRILYSFVGCIPWALFSFSEDLYLLTLIFCARQKGRCRLLTWKSNYYMFLFDFHLGGWMWRWHWIKFIILFCTRIWYYECIDRRNSLIWYILRRKERKRGRCVCAR